MVKYRAWHQKYEPKERWSTFYIAGIIFAEPFVEGLRRAGKNLTPETFVKAMETMKDWQGIGPPHHLYPHRPSGRQARFLRAGSAGRQHQEADGLDADHLLIRDAGKERCRESRRRGTGQIRIPSIDPVDSELRTIGTVLGLGFRRDPKAERSAQVMTGKQEGYGHIKG